MGNNKKEMILVKIVIAAKKDMFFSNFKYFYIDFKVKIMNEPIQKTQIKKALNQM